MDIQKIREDFAILRETPGKKPPVYLDSACQSLRPDAVAGAVARYYAELAACSGRSSHRLGAAVTRGVDQARAAVARFINAPRREEVLFTRNTTEGINLVANALAFQPGEAVLVTDKEHNSNLIPWQVLARKKGITLKIIPTSPDGAMDLAVYQKLLDGNPVRLVSLGHTSNLDGVTHPAMEIIKLAHKSGALVLLDAAQSAPHRQINVKALDVDFLAASGHKMLGPSGSGFLYGKYALLEKMEPFLVGGDTVASSTYETCEFLPPPEKFEAGLQDYAGILGLGAAVGYLQKAGFDFIQKQELALNEFATGELHGLPGFRLIGPEDPRLRGGLLTFYFEDLDSHRAAIMLDQMAGVMVRSGQHCVHSWFHSRGIAGSVRASFYFYNTLEEARIFVEALKKIRKVL